MTKKLSTLILLKMCNLQLINWIIYWMSKRNTTDKSERNLIAGAEHRVRPFQTLFRSHFFYNQKVIRIFQLAGFSWRLATSASSSAMLSHPLISHCWVDGTQTLSVISYKLKRYCGFYVQRASSNAIFSDARHFDFYKCSAIFDVTFLN